MTKDEAKEVATVRVVRVFRGSRTSPFWNRRKRAEGVHKRYVGCEGVIGGVHLSVDEQVPMAVVGILFNGTQRVLTNFYLGELELIKPPSRTVRGAASGRSPASSRKAQGRGR